jgi:antitoxin (DNA-binding transcriptional repressor) of toxin-antitoxin stability system
MGSSTDFTDPSGGFVMTQVTIPEAQHRLPERLAAVEAGEIVMIQSDKGRTFTLSVQPPAPLINPNWPGYPHAGSAKGLLEIPDDFDEPLDELNEYLK